MSRKKGRARRPRSKGKGGQSAPAPRPVTRWIIPVFAGGCAVVVLIAFSAFGPDFSPKQHGSMANAANPEQVATGAVLYARHCSTCHGADLEGQPDWQKALPDGSFPAPPHDETGHTWHHGDALLFQVTKNGGKPTARGWTSGMPAFHETLNDSEIWSVIAFIKSSWPQKTQALQDRRNR